MKPLLKRIQTSQLDTAFLDVGDPAAYIVAALHPERVQGLLTLSVGYGTNDPRQKIAYAQARAYWYHWFMAP
jgi:hypothetical protein